MSARLRSEMWTVRFVISLICFELVQVAASQNSIFEGNIYFEFYNESNEISYKSNSFGDDLVGGSGCNSSDNVALIIPGWLETCETTWVHELIGYLRIHRGGCILCMDYSIYSRNLNYYGFVSEFYSINEVLINKLHQFVQEEFFPEKIFIFGFSYGAQLALEAGRRFGKKLIGRIDACEPAGPGFDSNATYSLENPMDSAEFVQCIHTSYDKGTNKRSCHQNWHMGNCGLSQLASGPYPLGSHGLCPYFYNSAFENKFYAIPIPSACVASNRLPPNILDEMAMGYVFNDLSIVNDTVGYDYYADTFQLPPYHIEVDPSINS